MLEDIITACFYNVSVPNIGFEPIQIISANDVEFLSFYLD